MVNYQRIIKDCFWDMQIDTDALQEIVGSDGMQKKLFLFEKILLNSTKLFADLAIFSKKDLKELLQNYKIPRFNYEYTFRRKNMAEVYFFDQPLLIDELKWIA